MNLAEYRQLKPNKYRNTKVTADGHLFDSKKEAARYSELKLLEAHGAITDLEIQPSFRLVVNNKLICRYVADFLYYENGFRVVEDVKSEITRKNPVYRIKKKLLFALHGIEIREI
jgi:hypothetical protein